MLITPTVALSFTEKDDQILEIDRDIICRTITGKPVKPKTMGQKQYVDLIRKKMIVFGIGPAGTPKKRIWRCRWRYRHLVAR
ncbi:MAG: PhoH family protein [Clostridium fessum]